MALKPLNDCHAYFLEPVLLQGRESAAQWRIAITTISPEIRERIKAVVSDGIRGIKKVAIEYGWILQRCHFHLIADLSAHRGKWKLKRYRDRMLRESIYQTTRNALTVPAGQQLQNDIVCLKGFTASWDCPRQLRTLTKDFLRNLDAFRAYQIHSKLNLPTTTGTLEAMNKIIRKIVRPINNQNALLRWARATIRANSPLVCNKKNQPN